MAAMNIRELDAAAVAASVDVVDRVEPEQLDLPTPCGDWDLRALLAHMTIQHHGFAAAAEGRGGDPSAWVLPVEPSIDPVADYRRAAARVTEAFAFTDLADGRFDLHEFGVGAVFPATTAIGFHFIDYVVHAWDVGAAIGVAVAPSAELLPPALAITARVPTGDARTQPGAPFGPVVTDPPAEDGSWEQMLLLLGRSPLWRPGD